MTVIKKQNQPVTNEEVDKKCASNYNNGISSETSDSNSSFLRKIYNFFFQWNDTYYLTAMSLSTYIVAGVFLYYLMCSFIFVYISRTTGHIFIFKSVINSIIQMSNY